MAFREELQEKFGKAFGDNLIGYKVTVMEGVGAIIEGYQGVSSVTDSEIRFRASKTLVTVGGEKLEIKDINANEAYVAGAVSRIEIGLPNNEQN